eukprot:6208779-Pleurochrysis_carterae.AAC.1
MWLPTATAFSPRSNDAAPCSRVRAGARGGAGDLRGRRWRRAAGCGEQGGVCRGGGGDGRRGVARGGAGGLRILSGLFAHAKLRALCLCFALLSPYIHVAGLLLQLVFCVL